MSQMLFSSGKQQNLKSSQKLPKGGYDAVLSNKKTNNVSLRQSTGNLAAHFSTDGTKGNKTSKSTSDLQQIEAEYIKNLQQQVYFLELETNYLREQARKAAELQPQMSAEAKRMLDKLRELQIELDGTRLEVKHKESSAEILKMERERVLTKLKAAEDSHQREKRLLLDEIVQLKKEKQLLDKSIVNKDAQIVDIQHEMEQTESNTRSFDNKQRLLESQLNQKSDQLNFLQKTLEEKRIELLKAEEKLHNTEEKYYTSAAVVHDKVKEDLREEIRLLKQKLKEMEMNVSQDRYMHSMMSDDSAQIEKENSILNQKIIELQSQLNLENAMRDNLDSGHSQNITELSMMKDQEKRIRIELDQTKDQLKMEQQRIKQIIDQLSKHEQLAKGQQQQLNEATPQTRVEELSVKNDSMESENYQLRCDKNKLVERITQLKKMAEEKQLTINDLKDNVNSLEEKLKTLENLQELQSTIHSQKWEEFGRLAESMKTLSRNMVKNTSQKPWLKSTDVLEF